MLSARLIAALERRSEDEVLELYREHPHHFSPVLGASAAVFREGRILLIKRADNGLWALPGGHTEVGEVWAQSAQRELKEEAGLDGSVTELLGIFDSIRWRTRTKSQLYDAVFLVEAAEGEPVHGPGTTDVGFFAEDALPEMTPGHRRWVPLLFKLRRGEVAAPYFDPVDEEDAPPHAPPRQD